MDNNTASPHGVEGGEKLLFPETVRAWHRLKDAWLSYRLSIAEARFAKAQQEVIRIQVALFVFRVVSGTRSLPTGGDDGTV